MSSAGRLRFSEVQRFRDVGWVMVLVFGLALTQWYMAFQQIVLGHPMGNNPATDELMIVLWLLFGVGLPLFFLQLKLVVEVYDAAILIRFWPLVRRVISRHEIAEVEVREYRPLAEFGGWGIRGLGGRIAYNVRGNRGVELTLVDGRVVLLGSQQPEALAAAIGLSY